MSLRLEILAVTAIAVATLTGPQAVAASDDAVADATTRIPGLSMASNLFREFCIDHRSDITALIDVLPENGFEWRADDRRFFHPTHDLSIALVQLETGFACSMLFATDSNPSVSAALFAKSTATPTVPVNMGFPPKTNERDYIHAIVAAEKE